MEYKAEVKVTLKKGINDPQGLAVETVLKRIGLYSNTQIKTGKFFNLEFESENSDTAYKYLQKICEEILTNPCLEEYQIIEVKQK